MPRCEVCKQTLPDSTSAKIHCNTASKKRKNLKALKALK